VYAEIYDQRRPAVRHFDDIGSVPFFDLKLFMNGVDGDDAFAVAARLIIDVKHFDALSARGLDFLFARALKPVARLKSRPIVRDGGGEMSLLLRLVRGHKQRISDCKELSGSIQAGEFRRSEYLLLTSLNDSAFHDERSGNCRPQAFDGELGCQHPSHGCVCGKPASRVE
jgi:hypothetical protein